MARGSLLRRWVWTIGSWAESATAWVDAIALADRRWQFTRQLSGLIAHLRKRPLKFMVFLVCCLASTAGIVAYLVRGPWAGVPTLWRVASATGAMLVLASAYLLALNAAVCLFVRQSADTNRFVERARSYVFLPSWQSFQPRYLYDLRDLVAEWSYLHGLQLILVPLALFLAPGPRGVLVVGALLHGTVVAAAALTYVGVLPITPWAHRLWRPARAGEIEFRERLTMRLDFLEPDNFAFESWQVQPVQVVYKKCFDHELRNAIGLDNTAVELVRDAALPVGDIEMAFAVDDRDGDMVGVECPERMTRGVVSVTYDDEVVLRKTLPTFVEGWNDFPMLPRPSGGKAVSKIAVSASGDRPIYLAAPRIVRRVARPRTIIVLLLDNLRKDAVGLFGGDPADTPNIDRFFRDYTRYDRALAQGEWTKAIFASMFTSLYPSHHRVTDRWFDRRPISGDVETLAEVMHRHGYYTFGLMTNARNSQQFGYARGFDRYVFRNGQRYREVSHRDITLRAIEELCARPNENKFLFLHYFDLHTPFDLRTPFALPGTEFSSNSFVKLCTAGEAGTFVEDAAIFSRLYLNVLREMDFMLGSLFDRILQSPWRDEVAVVLVADHGTTLPTDGPRWLSKDLTDARVNVPLLVRVPWRAETHGHVSTDLVEASIDLYPTILDIAGVDDAHSAYSRSVLPDRQGVWPAKPYALTESIFGGEYQCRIERRTLEFARHFSWLTGKLSERVCVRSGQQLGPESVQAEMERFRELTRKLALFQPGDDPDVYH